MWVLLKPCLIVNTGTSTVKMAGEGATAYPRLLKLMEDVRDKIPRGQRSVEPVWEVIGSI